MYELFKRKESWTTWRGAYRGVAWEIKRRNPPEERPPYDLGSWWCSYLLLEKSRMLPDGWKAVCLPKTNKGPYGYENYMDLPLDFHGGITYYDVVEDGEVVKIGCDYNHLWDQERTYAIEDVYYDLIKTIRKFRRHFVYKRWCGNCGKIVHESKGIERTAEGSHAFICMECAEKRQQEAGLTT